MGLKMFVDTWDEKVGEELGKCCFCISSFISLKNFRILRDRGSSSTPP